MAGPEYATEYPDIDGVVPSLRQVDDGDPTVECETHVMQAVYDFATQSVGREFVVTLFPVYDPGDPTVPRSWGIEIGDALAGVPGVSSYRERDEDAYETPDDAVAHLELLLPFVDEVA